MYAEVPGSAPDFSVEGGSPLFSNSRAPLVPHRRHHQTLQFGQAGIGPGGQGCRQDQAGGRFRLGVGGHVTYARTDQLRQEGHNRSAGTVEQNNHVQSLNHNGSEWDNLDFSETASGSQNVHIGLGLNGQAYYH
jgi:hypothetical protein